MRVRIPFEFGDYVYPLVLKTSERITCPNCQGVGYTGHWEDEWSRDHYVYCRQCGDGRIQGWGIVTVALDPPVWEVREKCKITAFCIQEKQIFAEGHKLEDVFALKREAITESNRRNRALKKSKR